MTPTVTNQAQCMAAILSLLLRSRFPQVQCLAYSCVSAIFSEQLAEESKEWITSCTVGKDIFGRLNWTSAKFMRDHLLDVLRRCKVSKEKVIRSIFWRKLVLDDLLYSPEEVPQADSFRTDVQEHITRMQEQDLSNPIEKIPMYMPGRIIYMEKTQTEVQPGNCCAPTTKSTYQGVWVEDRSQLKDVQISSRLLLDHMPDFVARVLEESLQAMSSSPNHTADSKV